ncbi:hypothetical protein EBI_27622 [Enterocytozoon bieneusi H348]|nr:hypothetical protein EBI_25881 [Enterocytozoon bieneusi H348]EED43117.1 hypothetical protein EBI_27622 [Enterocytozoon bieneusi H348]|eukprot:XP_001828007.1 hypothetical protein EBI_25881 [Enterocytozoon bieneusi H348]
MNENKFFKFSNTELATCKDMAHILGYKFDNQSIEIMLNLFKLGASSDTMIQFLYTVQTELNQDSL